MKCTKSAQKQCWGVHATQVLRTVYSHIKALLVATVAGLLLAGAVAKGAALPYTYIENAILPELAKATDLAVGHPIRVGEPWLLAAARDGRVFLYEVSSTTTAAYQELSGFPSPAVSLVFADYDGDGKDDLWIGSAGSGNIYVYSMDAGYPMLGKSNDRVWAKIVRLLTPDLNGDHFADAVALTDTGVVYAFVRQESGLTLVGNTGAREGKVQHITAGDLNNDGREEVALARDGYMAVWSWTPTPTDSEQGSSTELARQFPVPVLAASGAWPIAEEQPQVLREPAKTLGRFTRIWEFDAPKGLITGLAVSDFNGDGAWEMLATTSQNRVYVFSSEGVGGFMQRSDEEAAQLASGYHSMLSNDRGGTLLFAAMGSSMAIWRHKGGTGWQFEPVWQSEFDLKFTRALSAGEWLVVAGADGVRFFRQTSRDYVRVVVDGEPYAGSGLIANPVVVHGEVLLAAKDWATILGLPMPAWNSAGRLTLIKGLQYMIVTLGSKEALVNGRTANLRNEPRNIGGLVFLPAEAVNLITGGVAWQPRTRTLTITR